VEAFNAYEYDTVDYSHEFIILPYDALMQVYTLLLVDVFIA
jgi:hypothetical protein